MSSLESFIFMISLCLKLINNDLITPSEAFTCKQVELEIITNYFDNDVAKYNNYLKEYIVRDFN
tara:strand:- start:60 stop:251 length:192 start_codon:yes stop_codon:yes gene_type:complete